MLLNSLELWIWIKRRFFSSADPILAKRIPFARQYWYDLNQLPWRTSLNISILKYWRSILMLASINILTLYTGLISKTFSPLTGISTAISNKFNYIDENETKSTPKQIHCEASKPVCSKNVNKFFKEQVDSGLPIFMDMFAEARYFSFDVIIHNRNLPAATTMTIEIHKNTFTFAASTHFRTKSFFFE